MKSSTAIASAPTAFDKLAQSYDDSWTCSLTGTLQRNAVWREIDLFFREGMRVLDLGCGTGADALHLARRGVRVVASDGSSQMLEAARRKAESEGLLSLIDFEHCPIEEMGRLRRREPFDGVLSNFGALNCVQDIQRAGSAVAELVRPSGILALCTLGRFCLWETAWYLGRRDPRKAFRRMRRGGAPANLGSAIQVHYPSVRRLTNAFRRHFRRTRFRGVGILVPPSYAESWAQSHSRLCRFLYGMEARIAGWPLLRAAADHRLLIFRREG